MTSVRLAKHTVMYNDAMNGCRIVRQRCWLSIQTKHISKKNQTNQIKCDHFRIRITFRSFSRTVPSHDLWQFGIVLFVCLTGCLPWQKAASDDPRYMRYLIWQSSNMVIPIKRTPKLFKLLTNRACKLFRKFLEPIPDRRPKNMSDLQKFLDDRWLAKNAEKDMIGEYAVQLCTHYPYFPSFYPYIN